MTSRDFGFLTLRNTTAYQPNGLPVPPNTVFVTSTNGSGIFTNNMTISSIVASTLEVNTLISKLKVTSTLNANNISTGNLTANNAVINTLLSGSITSGSIEASTISVISTLNLLNPSGNPLELTWNDTYLYIDGFPVATDSTVSSVSSIHWESNTAGDGNIVNKNLGTGLTNYLVGIGYNKASSINATLDVLYAGGLSQGNVLNISTANNNRLTVDSNGVVSITSSLSTNAINMTSGTITGLSTINGLVWPPEDDALWSRNGSTIYNDNPGGVGIGTSTPSTTLDVIGDIRIGSSYSLANTSSFIVSLGRSGTTSGLPRSALIQSDGKDMTISNQVNGSLAFGTNNNFNLTILPDGTVSTSNNLKIAAPTNALVTPTLLQVGDYGNIDAHYNIDNTSSIIIGPGVSPNVNGIGGTDSGKAGLFIGTTDPQANNTGGAISLGGRNRDFTNEFTAFARISGVSQNDTGESGNLVFETLDQGTMYERMRILRNGNIGINNNNPQYTLDVNGNIAVDSVKMQTNGSLIEGTTSGLYIEDNIGMTFGNNGMTTTYASFGTTGAFFNNGIVINSGDIDTSNNINVTKSSSNEGYVNLRNGSALYAYNASNNLTITLDGQSGNITAANFPTPSDERLKNNINTIENPLSTLTQMRGVSYYLNRDSSKQIGFIAQEVEKVLPEVVMTDKSSEEYKSITYGNISALIVEAIKELSAKVDLLMNR